MKVKEHPGEEEVREDVIDTIRTSVESASSFSDGETANYLVFSDNDEGEPRALKQACYLPSTSDGLPMMGKVPGKDRSKTYVSASHTCWVS